MDAAAHARVNPWVVTFAVMLATFMEVLDTTVVNVSIPHIAGNLAGTIEEGTWVVTSCLVSNAIILPLSGWLANYIGTKKLLLTSVAGFTLTSLVLRIGHQRYRPDFLSRAPRTYRRRSAASGPGHSAGDVS
ncbi:MAG: MFS transporter [Candidatus Sulfotelmatobacter sp.]|jgi:DHA2 family multidrug resistance protein